MYYYAYTQCVLWIYIFLTNYKGKMQRWFKTSWKVTNLPHFQQTKNFSPLMQKVFDMPSLIHKKQKVRRLLSISHKDMQDPRQNIVNNCHSSFKTIFFFILLNNFIMLSSYLDLFSSFIILFSRLIFTNKKTPFYGC